MSADVSAAHRGAPLGSTFLSFLPRAVREPGRPLATALVGWLTAFVPAILLGAALALVAPEAQTPQFPFEGPLALFMLVVSAPVLETLIMGTVLLILLKFLSRPVAVLASALGWGIVHSLEVPIWGLVIWWPFLVFSTVFVSWRDRSLFAAYALAATVHGLNNLLPALPVAFPAQFGA